MYRRCVLMIVFILSILLNFGCKKESTEPTIEKPSYFTKDGLPYVLWHDTGAPFGVLSTYSDQQKINFKAKTYYYNPTEVIAVLDSIINVDNLEGYNKNVVFFDVVYDPAKKGAYNMNAELSEPTQMWGGLQRLLLDTEQQKNSEMAIQIWMKILEAPKGTRLFVDLGDISEDVIPNQKLDTEDKNWNVLLDNGEDTGLDGLSDVQEPSYNAATNPDPSADDFSFDVVKRDYTMLNGTEGNLLLIEQGRKPDTEDLNGDYYLETTNNFFRYEIPLDTSPAFNKYITGTGINGWIKINIPVQAYSSIVGFPNLNFLRVIRLWFNGAGSKIHLRFAELSVKAL